MKLNSLGIIANLRVKMTTCAVIHFALMPACEAQRFGASDTKGWLGYVTLVLISEYSTCKIATGKS